MRQIRTAPQPHLLPNALEQPFFSKGLGIGRQHFRNPVGIQNQRLVIAKGQLNVFKIIKVKQANWIPPLPQDLNTALAC